MKRNAIHERLIQLSNIRTDCLEHSASVADRQTGVHDHG